MNREPPKSPHSDRLRDDVTGEQQVPSAVAYDAVAPPDAQPVATPKPSGPRSEDDQVEAGFDNVPF